MTLSVDGPRPAVAWVTSLPRDWRVSPPERLVLLCLACDAFNWESAPSYDLIAEWTGMHRSSCAEILARLSEATEYRPALIVKASVRGRRRTVWRLAGPSEPSGPAGHFEPDPNRPAPPDTSAPDEPSTVAQPSANRPAPPDDALCPKPSVVGDTVKSPRSVVETRAERDAPTTGRGTRIPEGFTPSPEMLEWVRRECPQVPANQHDRFVDYFRAATGSRAVKRDWPATWRNWMRRAQDDITAGRASPAGPRRSTTDDRVATGLDLARQLAAEEAAASSPTQLMIGA